MYLMPLVLATKLYSSYFAPISKVDYLWPELCSSLGGRILMSRWRLPAALFLLLLLLMPPIAVASWPRSPPPLSASRRSGQWVIRQFSPLQQHSAPLAVAMRVRQWEAAAAFNVAALWLPHRSGIGNNERGVQHQDNFGDVTAEVQYQRNGAAGQCELHTPTVATTPTPSPLPHSTSLCLPNQTITIPEMIAAL